MRKVLIVDDHAVVAHGLKSALELYGYEVVGTALTVKQGQALLAHLNPDVLLLDINLPDGSGFELLLWVRKITSELRVILLSFNDDPEYINAARGAGANAYIVKDAPMSEILAAVDFSIASPQSFASAYSHTKVRRFELTARELDILRLLALGKSNNEMGQLLYLSLSTVKTHVSSILRKLEAHNRVSAIKIARENGLLT